MVTVLGVPSSLAERLGLARSATIGEIFWLTALALLGMANESTEIFIPVGAEGVGNPVIYVGQ